MNNLLYIITFLLLFISCKEAEVKSSEDIDYASGILEAREDSLALEFAYNGQSRIERSLFPSVETQPIQAESTEDAADDPAIWIHPKDPSKSLVFGSNKKGGLAVYDLNGKEVGYYPLGEVNNVDILKDFSIGDSEITVLGCSNRTDQSVDLFQINEETGELTDIADGLLRVDTSLIDDIYGFCFAFDRENQKPYCVINGKNGLVQQFEMIYVRGKIQLEIKRSIQFESQTEGMVADSELGHLYVGEEGGGIWKIPIDVSKGDTTFLLANSDNSNANIVYDIEGLSIYKQNGQGYLVASSQGNFSYAVFDRTGNNEYLGSFKIEASDKIDGVEETDGIDIVSDSLSPQFPTGIMVAQDGFNYQGEEMESQNFKYINFEYVLAQFDALKSGKPSEK